MRLSNVCIVRLGSVKLSNNLAELGSDLLNIFNWAKWELMLIILALEAITGTKASVTVFKPK